MLVASFTSLILPGIELGGFLPTALGTIFGFSVMTLIENLSPHEHVVKGREGALGGEKLRKLTLIVIGVTIHNIPEGISVGISASYSWETGVPLALAIAIQDIPEGLVVTLPLMVATNNLMAPLLAGLGSGLIESLFAILGYFLMDVFEDLLSLGLGFGGGAMLYVTVKEVLPEIYSSKNREFAVTLSFLLGFLLMLFLDSI